MSLQTKYSSVINKKSTLSNFRTVTGTPPMAVLNNSTERQKPYNASISPARGASLVRLFQGSLGRNLSGQPSKVQSQRSSSSRNLSATRSSTSSKPSKLFQNLTLKNKLSETVSVTQKKRTNVKSCPPQLRSVSRTTSSIQKVEKRGSQSQKPQKKISNASRRDIVVKDCDNDDPVILATPKSKKSFSCKETPTIPCFVSSLPDECEKEGTGECCPQVKARESYQEELGGSPPPEKVRGRSCPPLERGKCPDDSNANLDKVAAQAKHNSRPRNRSRVSFLDDNEDDEVFRRERDTERKAEKMKSFVIAAAVKTGTNIDPGQAAASKVFTYQHASFTVDEVSEVANSTSGEILNTVGTDTDNVRALPSSAIPSHRTGSLPSFHHRHHVNSPTFINTDQRDIPQDARAPPHHHHYYRPFPEGRPIPPLRDELGILSNTVVAKFVEELIKGDREVQPEVSESDEETGSFIAAAYNIVIALLDYLFQIFGFEQDLEPQEDFVRYNGYKIKVYGEDLLLESVHMNRDYQFDSKDGTCCRSIHSLFSFQPHTLSTEALNSQSRVRDGGGEGRVRIVVRIRGSLGHQLQQAEPESLIGLEHHVLRAYGKWTFFLTQTRPIPENGEYYDKSTKTKRDGTTEKKNFVEIGCPTGVHPETIEYGLMNGLLYIDAP